MNKLLLRASLASLVCLLMAGCPTPPQDNGTDGTDGGSNTTDGTGGTDGNDGMDGTDGTDGTDGGAAGDGDVSESALSFEGTVSGAASTVSSTDASTPESGRKVALRALDGSATAWLTDLDGNRLKDAEGNEYPDFPVNTDGSFEIDGLPVGVDIVLNIDTDGDGAVDLKTIIHIPQDENGEGGTLDDAHCDPLSTLVLAKLYRILLAQGIDPRQIDISPSALIERIRDAYEHLLEDSGIEQEVTIEDILNLNEDELSDLFDSIIPTAARRGMEMAEANIALTAATDVQGVVQAVAKILLKGGFIIVDDPGGPDLSALANEPNVESMTFDEFFQQQQFGPDGPGGMPPEGEEPFIGPAAVQTIVYINTVSEPDRNFANQEDMGPQGRGGPWFSDHVLARMAELYLNGATVSLGDLYRVIVDLEIGLGARLSYFRWDPETGGVEVFESADGAGIELNMEDLFNRIHETGGFDPGPEAFEMQQQQVRALLQEFFAETAEPAFERVFDGILAERIASVDAFARAVRGRRVHLPFSRSGPSRFFVVATADKFRDPNDAMPVTVDVQTNDEGVVTRVTYNAGGDGKFYVGFGPMTEAGMEVELISRRTGKPLHDHHGGPQFLEMNNGAVFQPVGGQSFYEAFSDTGTHYPGAPALSVPNFGFDPDLPPDPETNPPVFEIFVLVTEPGPGGEPLRVDYADGVATINAAGRYYLQFDEGSDQGLFTLISESGEIIEETPGEWQTRIRVDVGQVQGGTIEAETFTHVYGTDVPNPGYDPTGAPYYDDINDNGTPDAGEPSFDFRERLWDPDDWRSTFIEHYYRRADDHGFVRPENVDWQSETPRTLDDVALVPRNLKPRLNAFRFGRPNVTLNLLTAFSPPEFFNGTQSLGEDTRLNPFMALALTNLVFDSIHNVSAFVDPDGPGPLPPHRELVEAHLFVAPVGDPVQLMVDGLESAARK